MNPQILFLEDDRYAAEPYCDALRDVGLEVAFFENIDAAVNRSREIDFDVAVLDLHVPPGESFDNVATAGGYKTGLVFAQELRRRDPKIGIVLISGEDSDIARQWCAKHDAFFYWKLQLHRDDFVVRVASLANSAISRRLASVTKLFDRFHRVAKKLESRYDTRPTIRINDEYDVQDLLHALLLTKFDDIRAEDWIPSYAGGTSRVDFLLPQLKLIIEVKYITAKLRDKRVGEQLVIDCARYRSMPEFDILVCFLYDPDHQLKNPAGLQRDVQSLGSTDLSIIVVVRP